MKKAPDVFHFENTGAFFSTLDGTPPGICCHAGAL